MLITAPVSSRSGYGDHARDLVNSFIKHDKYDIKILDVRWGECPRNALDNNNESDKQILNRILPQPNLDRQPDIYIDIRIPNEFQTYGKFNIGITAGIETNAVSPEWIDGCNKMDLVIVPSEHSKDGFVNSVYDKIQNLPDGKQQKIGEHKFNKPIEVVFEGADESYKPLENEDINQDFFDYINDMIPEEYAFLFVGQWTQGGYGEDRKDIGKLIKVFIEAFANKKKQPALLLKTSGATFSVMDKADVKKKIDNIKSSFPSDWKLPSIYLLHGDLTKEELNYLYNHPKIKSMVSFTHGEGFGRPLLEATMTGLPVITTGWSGHIDFLDSGKSMLMSGELQQIPKSVVWKDILIEQSQWFVVNEQSAYKALNHAVKDSYDIKRKAQGLMRTNREKFTLDNMTQKLDEIIEKYTKDLPSQVQLKLPKLKKVGGIELPKIKLPKLKKVSDEV